MTDDKSTRLIGIRVSSGIDSILEEMAAQLGKKKAVLARELMEDKMFDLGLIKPKLPHP